MKAVFPMPRESASTRGFTTVDPERQGIRWDAMPSARAVMLGFHPSLPKTAEPKTSMKVPERRPGCNPSQPR